MLLQQQSFALFADYHQFCLWDRGMNPMAPVDYDDQDVERRIKTGPHVVVIQPQRAMTVKVEVQIHDSEPSYRAVDWDHIAEASLDLPTGQLQVHESTGGPVAEFQVTPGSYRARSFHGGLATIGESGIDGNDHYRIVLWSRPMADSKIIKKWVPAAPGRAKQ
jgi:hypothetical protein